MFEGTSGTPYTGTGRLPLLGPEGRYESAGADMGAPYEPLSTGASRLLLCSSVPVAIKSSELLEDVDFSAVFVSIEAWGDSSTFEEGPLFTTAATCWHASRVHRNATNI